MEPKLVHACRECAFQIPVLFSASVFSQTLTCPHCGAVSRGINIAPRSPPPGMLLPAHLQQQEELSRLFSQNLTLSPPPPVPVVEQQPESKPSAAQYQPIRYISQHYHHSWHAVPKSAPASVTSYPNNAHSEVDNILTQNGIDPEGLVPPQLHLFRNAGAEQRLRLLELWRISPPTEGKNLEGKDTWAWDERTLEEEENMAKWRFDSLRQSLPATTDNAMEATSAMEEVSALAAPASPGDSNRQAEPYILSGYEMLAKREYEEQALKDSTRYNQATDPAYKAAAGVGSWGKTDLQDMENQYGAFAMMREQDSVCRPILHDLDHDMVM